MLGSAAQNHLKQWRLLDGHLKFQDEPLPVAKYLGVHHHIHKSGTNGDALVATPEVEDLVKSFDKLSLSSTSGSAKPQVMY